MISACQNPSNQARRPRRRGFVIGRANFSKISAVDGIRLTSPMKKRAAEADYEGLSPEEYRQAIVRSYCKA
jgi:hypothetical protein